MHDGRPMNLVQHLATFVRIADAGNISRAARSLGLSAPMASRHLRALEKEFGVVLMRRSTRRVDLTEAGTELLGRARRLLAGLDETRDALRPSRLASGLVTMSVPVSFGLAKIAPAIPKLLTKNPQLSLDIRFEDAVIDLLGDAVDLAIRCGFPPPDSPFVVSRRLASFERVLCASPSFLKRAGTPTNVEDLAGTRCVILGAGTTRWHFETLAGPREVVVEGRLRTSTVLAMREAALAGLGVAQMPLWLVDDDLRKHRLVRVLEEAVLPTVSVLGLVHTSARNSSRLRLLQDFLASELPQTLVRTPG
jgi:DNA-binding transcriptional LysR family regulator